MIRVTVVVREQGRTKPDYSLEFDLPALPREGDYISIQRPDEPKPFGEDLIVRKVWWRLGHPNTGGYETGTRQGGRADEIFVECDPAIGPWSSKAWKKSLKFASEQGTVPYLEVDRLTWPDPEN